MTIMCVVTDGSVPGIRPCTIRKEHRVVCESETCTGCLPRPAVRGFLCAKHFDDVEHAYARWDDFARLISLVGDRAVKQDGSGRTSSATGYVPIPAVKLAMDECNRFLASSYALPRFTLTAWVSTSAGARDAIQFAKAAENAYTTHEVRERERPIDRKRCPHCNQLTLLWRPPRYERDNVDVVCMNEECGRLLDQSTFEAIETTEKRRKTA